MRLNAFAFGCILALAACSGQAADKLPPLPEIEKATLAYANCVDTSARKLAGLSGETEMLARRAVASCRELRTKALSLKGVPVMAPTVAEYDATHLGLARQAIEHSRAKLESIARRFEHENSVRLSAPFGSVADSLLYESTS